MTQTKSRKFLTNVSYNGVKEEDLFDRSFVFDIYVLTILYFGKKDFWPKGQGNDKHVLGRL